MENIFTVAKPYLTFISLTGFFPMSFDGPASKGLLKTRKLEASISSVALAILIYILIICVINKSYVDNDSVILVAGWNIYTNMQTASFIFMLAYQILRRNKIANLLGNIRSVDKEVRLAKCIHDYAIEYFDLLQCEKLNIFIDFRLHKIFVRCVIVSIFSIMPLFVAVTVGAYYLGEFNMTNGIIYVFINFLNFIIVSQFFLATTAIRERFSALNRSLKCSKSHGTVKVVAAKNPNLIDYESVYQSLCDAIKIVNDSLTIHFVFVFAALLVNEI